MATTQLPFARLAGARPAHSRRLWLLRAILAANIVSTAVHYTHNYIEIRHYPQTDLIGTSAVRFAIAVAWPVLTAVGLFGYSFYAREMYRRAAACLALSSLLGIATLGHFLFGQPHIPALWYATIFTDGGLGFALFMFAYFTFVQALKDERGRVDPSGPSSFAARDR